MKLKKKTKKKHGKKETKTKQPKWKEKIKRIKARRKPKERKIKARNKKLSHKEIRKERREQIRKAQKSIRGKEYIGEMIKEGEYAYETDYAGIVSNREGAYKEVFTKGVKRQEFLNRLISQANKLKKYLAYEIELGITDKEPAIIEMYGKTIDEVIAILQEHGIGHNEGGIDSQILNSLNQIPGTRVKKGITGYGTVTYSKIKIILVKGRSK